ncbi:hypothetical protein APR03_003665 [Promicromonospora thailandica]|uniref:Uncharacterized protein n=1 Tax=Promicromonospora thailandica TaxID=765201 RepID=A0A9X2JZQ8_9MICO|nr:hypothetical protein [Promicromonospora thailandica]BFF19967.1 hypothetical protein GCM10025730_34880 [Promicromonospora thailandica]
MVMVKSNGFDIDFETDRLTAVPVARMYCLFRAQWYELTRVHRRTG